MTKNNTTVDAGKVQHPVFAIEHNGNSYTCATPEGIDVEDYDNFKAFSQSLKLPPLPANMRKRAVRRQKQFFKKEKIQLEVQRASYFWGMRDIGVKIEDFPNEKTLNDYINAATYCIACHVEPAKTFKAGRKVYRLNTDLISGYKSHAAMEINSIAHFIHEFCIDSKGNRPTIAEARAMRLIDVRPALEWTRIAGEVVLSKVGKELVDRILYGRT